MEKTLGGDRLGSGNKNKVWMHNYERSSHDLSYLWKSTMSAGTLVPFMSEVALPGDTFDINLDADGLTHPTTGPLFGSYKMQLDVFQVPMRLYQGKLHMNMLGIGMDMSKVTLPQLWVVGGVTDRTKTLDNQQINPSALLSYLGIRGCGYDPADPTGVCGRGFNAIPYLSYWDIYKNYYANKQEEIGVVIHKNINGATPVVTGYTISNATAPVSVTTATTTPVEAQLSKESKITITCTSGVTNTTSPGTFGILVHNSEGTDERVYPADKVFKYWTVNGQTLLGEGPLDEFLRGIMGWDVISVFPQVVVGDTSPEMVTFPLVNIDKMRQNILTHTSDNPYVIDGTTNLAPYHLPLVGNASNPIGNQHASQWGQEGLALKTYNSDLFNNWISTEWIDGPDGISAITAVDTSGGSFTIDELNLSKKVYNMLNRIALSGGSYDDWLDAVYTHDRQRSAENPIYLGGLIKNIVFQEVVSNVANTEADQPLGTLAGRGRVGNKHKGGHIIAKIDEPSYLIGIVSLTPNIDYSQGNKWDVNLLTLNDLHKPALDEIGFQDLLTDQMAWYDTAVDQSTGEITYKSAGKQPAWINYMTNVNQVRGNFADQKQQMYMTLNRRYGQKINGTAPTIADLTTYIDPMKFNHIFANTRRDAQNFWIQVAVNMTARRKMSAKVIPNL